MDTLLSAAHLLREIGFDEFAEIVSSDNTGVVRAFARRLVERRRNTLNLGDHTYRSLSIRLKEGEVFSPELVVARAKQMSAILGEGDARYIVAHGRAHGRSIPPAFDGLVLVFLDWASFTPGYHDRLTRVCICRQNDNFCLDEIKLDRWGSNWRVLRRVDQKKAT